MGSNVSNDVNFLTELWFGFFASLVVLLTLVLGVFNMIDKMKDKPAKEEEIDTRVPVMFADGSVAMIDPLDPDAVEAVRSVSAEETRSVDARGEHHGKPDVQAFYSPASGMPAKDISEYDWNKQDYETKTAGPIGEKTYD